MNETKRNEIIKKIIEIKLKNDEEIKQKKNAELNYE
jgi:hypothetical protein